MACVTPGLDDGTSGVSGSSFQSYFFVGYSDGTDYARELRADVGWCSRSALLHHDAVDAFQRCGGVCDMLHGSDDVSEPRQGWAGCFAVAFGCPGLVPEQ